MYMQSMLHPLSSYIGRANNVLILLEVSVMSSPSEGVMNAPLLNWHSALLNDNESPCKDLTCPRTSL